MSSVRFSLTVSDKAAKVSADNTVPGGSLPRIELDYPSALRARERGVEGGGLLS